METMLNFIEVNGIKAIALILSSLIPFMYFIMWGKDFGKFLEDPSKDGGIKAILGVTACCSLIILLATATLQGTPGVGLIGSLFLIIVSIFLIYLVYNGVEIAHNLVTEWWAVYNIPLQVCRFLLGLVSWYGLFYGFSGILI